LISKNPGISFIFYPPSGEAARRKCRRRRQIRYGAGYWKKSELFTNRTRTLNFDLICPCFARASVSAIASASFRRAKQKNFLNIFLITPRKNFFQLRERKFFCFAFLLSQESGNADAGGQKFIFPTPLFLFARLLGLRPQIFLAAGL